MGRVIEGMGMGMAKLGRVIEGMGMGRVIEGMGMGMAKLGRVIEGMGAFGRLCKWLNWAGLSRGWALLLSLSLPLDIYKCLSCTVPEKQGNV